MNCCSTSPSAAHVNCWSTLPCATNENDSTILSTTNVKCCCRQNADSVPVARLEKFISLNFVARNAIWHLMIKILAPKLDWTSIQCIANYQPEKRHNIVQSLKDYKENLISSISKNFEIRAILTADSRQAAVQLFQSNIKWHSDNNSRSGATVDTENGMPSFWKKIQVNCEELWKAKANTHLKVSVEKLAQPSE